MARRTRDATARSRIRAYLAERGSVRDEGGGATTTLREAIAYQGSAVAFIQLLTAMDEAGELVREIRGKRTYAISHGQESAGGVEPSAVSEMAARRAGPGIDYDELARSLLRELGRVLVSAAPLEGSATVAADVAERTDRAHELTAERDRLRSERDDYAARLESSRRQLNALAALFVGEDAAETANIADVTAAHLRGSGASASERAS